MAAQGTSAQPSIPGSASAKTAVPQKQAPIATKAVAKKELTRDLLVKAVTDEKNLRTIAQETGNTIHDVREALKANDLKTASMKDGAGKLGFRELNKVFSTIQAGTGNVAGIVAATGLSEVVVKVAIRKLKRDGDIIDSLSVPSAAATQQPM
jgi:hypothetical protein